MLPNDFVILMVLVVFITGILQFINYDMDKNGKVTDITINGSLLLAVISTIFINSIM